MKKVQSVQAIIMLFVMTLSVLTFTSCELQTNEIEDYGITKIELGSSDEKGIQKGYYISVPIKFSEETEIKKIYAQAYIDETVLDKDGGLEKAVRWVSSAPDAIEVSRGQVSYKGDKVPLKIKVNKKAIKENDEFEIYAENFDGSVKSDTIKIIATADNTAGSQTPEDDLASIKLFKSVSSPQESYVALTDREFKNTFSFYVYTDKSGEYKNSYRGKTNLTELIRCVSTDEKVVKVKTAVSTLSYSILFELEITGEGEAEIYFETIDGRIKSESVMIVSGNKYAKEAAATFHAGVHILSKVKYPTKNTNQIKHDRDPWFFENWGFKGMGPNSGRRIYVYSKNSESSSVGVNTVEINGLNVTIKGDVKTFSSGGMGVTCNYILDLLYNEEFTEYTVISEKYDVPEIIRDKLE